MTDHPLTDELTENISSFYLSDMGETGEGIRQDMRAAADWQLEQVIEQWEEVMDSTMTDIQVIREFDKRLKAMRPQEDNQ